MSTTNLLTRQEKAKELGISTSTLDRWVKKGMVRAIKSKYAKRNEFLPDNADINLSIEMQPNN